MRMCSRSSYTIGLIRVIMETSLLNRRRVLVLC